MRRVCALLRHPIPRVVTHCAIIHTVRVADSVTDPDFYFSFRNKSAALRLVRLYLLKTCPTTPWRPTRLQHTNTKHKHTRGFEPGADQVLALDCML